MKRWFSLLLTLCIALSAIGCPPVSALAPSLSYTEEDLETDNAFNPVINSTIGRGYEGGNSYIAQSFVASEDPVTGCRLHFKLGDNATMTIQVRSSLDGGNDSILYSGNYPLVSDPHNITGWWEFEFTRALQLEPFQTYYLVYWCDIYHSYCVISNTKYICNNLVNTSYHKVENSDEWTALYNRSYGYEIYTNPNAAVKGYPYTVDANSLMMHDGEEYYCFARTEDNTATSLTALNTSQGYYGMKVESGTPDTNGAVFTTYVDFTSAVSLSDYQHFYADVFISKVIATDYTLSVRLTDDGGNGGQYQTSLKGLDTGWHRIHFTQEETAKLGSGSWKNIKTVTLQGLSDAQPDGLYLVLDNLRTAKEEIETFSSGYYTDEELAETDFDATIDYIGKPAVEATVLYGDPTEDGKINSVDALFDLKVAVEKQTATPEQFKAGDVDANDLLNAVDALMILKYAVGLIQEFPAESEESTTVTATDFILSAEGLEKNTVYRINKSVFANLTGDIMPHDAARLASSLQGLINREMATTRVALVIVDNYTNTWYSYIEINDALLEGMDNTVVINSFDDFLTTFQTQLIQCGMILWDPDVPSTANVAETVCGLDGYIPVKYLSDDNSLYNRLLDMGVEVKLSLVDKFIGKGMIPDTMVLSTGSIKCDPYLWALDQYGERCSEHYMIYTPDGASATEGNIIYENDVHAKSLDYNHSFGYDYGIYHKAFFFDLSPVEDEAPCDDPTQALGTDPYTLKQILLNRYCRAQGEFGEIVGFPPWPLKYSSHNSWNTIGATTLEATFTTLVTQYNCYMDADGSITNCSLYAQFTLEDSYESIANGKEVTETFDENTMYLYMYTGDYDSAAWALEHLYNAYNDSARGSIPITWSITPSLSDRVPMLFDYLYKNQTENDYFSASDSGIGYVRPQGLFQSESARTLPDGDKEFIKISKQYFDRFDMDSVGFIIGKLSDQVCRTYNQFAPVGSNTNDSTWTPAVYVNTPYVRIKNGIGDPAATDEAMTTVVSGMYEFADSMRDYHVAGFRTIKFSASDLKRTQEAFIEYATEKDPDTTYKFVDYKTYFAMMNEAANGHYTLD